MRWVVTGGAALALLVACSGGSSTSTVELAAAEDPPASEEVCGGRPCEVLEGVVTEVDAGRGQLVVAVDLAWSPELRTGVGETRFTLSDATLFLPTQSGLQALEPGEDVLVRSTPEAPEGRHALSVVRVDRD